MDKGNLEHPKKEKLSSLKNEACLYEEDMDEPKEQRENECLELISQILKGDDGDLYKESVKERDSKPFDIAIETVLNRLEGNDYPRVEELVSVYWALEAIKMINQSRKIEDYKFYFNQIGEKLGALQEVFRNFLPEGNISNKAPLVFEFGKEMTEEELLFYFSLVETIKDSLLINNKPKPVNPRASKE